MSPAVLLDENMPRGVADGLPGAGHDVWAISAWSHAKASGDVLCPPLPPMLELDPLPISALQRTNP